MRMFATNYIALEYKCTLERVNKFFEEVDM